MDRSSIYQLTNICKKTEKFIQEEIENLFFLDPEHYNYNFIAYDRELDRGLMQSDMFVCINLVVNRDAEVLCEEDIARLKNKLDTIYKLPEINIDYEFSIVSVGRSYYKDVYIKSKPNITARDWFDTINNKCCSGYAFRNFFKNGCKLVWHNTIQAPEDFQLNKYIVKSEARKLIKLLNRPIQIKVIEEESSDLNKETREKSNDLSENLKKNFVSGIKKRQDNNISKEKRRRKKIKNIYLANDFIVELNKLLDLNKKFVEFMETIVVDRYLDDPDNEISSKDTFLKQGLFEFNLSEKWFVRLNTNIVNNVNGMVNGHTIVSIFNKDRFEPFIQYAVDHNKNYNGKQPLLINKEEIGTISNNEIEKIDISKKNFNENTENIKEFVEDIKKVNISELFVKAVEEYL